MNATGECKYSKCAAVCAYVAAAAGSLLIVAGLVWITYQYTKPEALTEDRAALRRKNLKELRAANDEAINNPNFLWKDQAHGMVHMPLEYSKEIVIKLYQNPAAGRTNLIAREEKATAKVPEKPSVFE